MQKEYTKAAVFEIQGDKILTGELNLATDKVLADRKTIVKWDRRKADRRVSDRSRRKNR